VEWGCRPYRARAEAASVHPLASAWAPPHYSSGHSRPRRSARCQCARRRWTQTTTASLTVGTCVGAPARHVPQAQAAERAAHVDGACAAAPCVRRPPTSALHVAELLRPTARSIAFLHLTSGPRCCNVRCAPLHQLRSAGFSTEPWHSRQARPKVWRLRGLPVAHLARPRRAVRRCRGSELGRSTHQEHDQGRGFGVQALGCRGVLARPSLQQLEHVTDAAGLTEACAGEPARMTSMNSRPPRPRTPPPPCSVDQ
jgi:hypothetical protein